MSKGLGTLGIVAAGVGAFALLFMQDSRRFNELAAGLTDEQRKLARKFWTAARRAQNDERAEHAAAVAQLERVEQARIALDRLGASTCPTPSPSTGP